MNSSLTSVCGAAGLGNNSLICGDSSPWSAAGRLGAVESSFGSGLPEAPLPDEVSVASPLPGADSGGAWPLPAGGVIGSDVVLPESLLPSPVPGGICDALGSQVSSGKATTGCQAAGGKLEGAPRILLADGVGVVLRPKSATSLLLSTYILATGSMRRCRLSPAGSPPLDGAKKSIRPSNDAATGAPFFILLHSSSSAVVS